MTTTEPIDGTDSWYSESDAEWFLTYGANELILAHDEESPVITARHALKMLVSEFGPERVKALVDGLVAQRLG